MLVIDGWHEAGMVVLGCAAGFLVQAGWSALCLAGDRMLANIRLEEWASLMTPRGPIVADAGWPLRPGRTTPGSETHPIAVLERSEEAVR